MQGEKPARYVRRVSQVIKASARAPRWLAWVPDPFDVGVLSRLRICNEASTRAELGAERTMPVGRFERLMGARRRPVYSLETRGPLQNSSGRFTLQHEVTRHVST